ncbi:hypothetical protein AAFC00_005383 [Neodothiora populina]
MPAITKWFSRSSKDSSNARLNVEYLSKYGDVVLPIEVTDGQGFSQLHQPLQFFLDASESLNQSSETRMYLAQASISDLPPSMSSDIPTPPLVLSAGKGDLYASSIWLGHAPTYTPLHRDPNPNLFVQLCGTKRMRLFRPEVGAAVFHYVQGVVGGSATATMRGVEMMEGREREVLEMVVWEDGASGEDGGGGGGGGGAAPWSEHCFECEVGSGDGLFIPKGWWHSVKGVGRGMNGSVNWWFR